MPDWQPGDPIYEEHEPGRVFQHEPMFEVIEPDSGRQHSAHWTPDRGWQ
jgi:hypothetical protein